MFPFTIYTWKVFPFHNISWYLHFWKRFTCQSFSVEYFWNDIWIYCLLVCFHQLANYISEGKSEKCLKYFCLCSFCATFLILLSLCATSFIMCYFHRLNKSYCNSVTDLGCLLRLAQSLFFKNKIEYWS